MSAEEDMDYQSLPSSIIENPPSPVRRRSSSRRRGQSLNSTHSHNVSRTSVRSTSSPKPTRGVSRRSTHSSIMRSSSVPSSNPPDHSQIAVPPLPFDCPSDDEQQQQKQSMSVTTRSGKMKKDAILSYFVFRTAGKYDCILCHKVSSTFS